MTTARKRSARAVSGSAPSSPNRDFTPVALRGRHDGWTPERQTEFIEALAECGCVDAACRRVGLDPSSAYRLRRRVDAQSFRQAWDSALSYAIRRLSDAAFSRAIHGVSRPVFYQGEQIGERRHYDERLTMFLLRYRDPARYGKWLDGMVTIERYDGKAIDLSKMVDRVEEDAYYRAFGAVVRRHEPIRQAHLVTPEELDAIRAHAEARREAAEERRTQREAEADWQAYLDTLGPDAGEDRSGGESTGT
ncbi:MAG: hypothetical protein WCS75_08610 [Sphingomonas sp.]|jgi:hypothetical protein|uniref:hypothetical protein n=1 Tax=Sphingomonas sp. TaxID=28214 RepID=UPI00356354A1